MTESPRSTRAATGIVVGLVVATPVLLAAGLLEARWNWLGAPGAETSFATAWIATAIWSLRSPDLVAFLRKSLRVAGGLTIALPLLSFTLFGWQEASSGVVARVNASLLLVGVATLLGTRAIRRQQNVEAPEPTGLAPLPAGGPTRAHSLAATLGAIVVAALKNWIDVLPMCYWS